jgi:hypothetical protein
MWLEKNWTPTENLGTVASKSMSFAHAEVIDVRSRAQRLNVLRTRAEEGTIVERWIENCLSTAEGNERS